MDQRSQPMINQRMSKKNFLKYLRMPDSRVTGVIILLDCYAFPIDLDKEVIEEQLARMEVCKEHEEMDELGIYARWDDEAKALDIGFELP